MFTRFYTQFIQANSGYQLFHKPTFEVLDYFNKTSLPERDALRVKALEFFSAQGITVQQIEQALDMRSKALIQAIEPYDHPFINASRLVKTYPNCLSFKLDTAEQAEKMQTLLLDFKIKCALQTNTLHFYLGLYQNPPYNFSVLNTRRAYFFDELIF